MSQRKSVSIRPLLRFFLVTAAAFVLMTAGWRFVADYTSRPAGFVARVVMEMGFSGSWVSKTRQTSHLLEIETRLLVKPTPEQIAQARAAGQYVPPNAMAEAVLEVDPARYGYGFPILFALLIAARTGKSNVARSSGFFKKAAMGSLLLVPFQAFTIVMVLLKDAAFRSGAGVTAGFTQTQVEFIAYGYQLGVLLLPTVAPIMIWLWLDKKYVTTVLVDGWFDKPGAKAVAPSSAGDVPQA